jgi:hypothetical protein
LISFHSRYIDYLYQDDSQGKYMLKPSQSVKTESVERLQGLWQKRYVPNLSKLSFDIKKSDYNELIKAASCEGRALTANKLKDHVIDVNCHMAWIQTKTLYAYIPNILDLNEARRITQFAYRVYRKLIEVYQENSVNPDTFNEKSDILSWVTPNIEKLAYALEPTLLLFQEQHMASKDWRALGFLTTQLNFGNKLILRKLTVEEQVLLYPYLKFIEEQVAMPWQRVCGIAEKYNVDSPHFQIVEHMFYESEEIAEVVFKQLKESLPQHRSRRGKLSDLGISHSCLRDLNMFQAYLWLCFLEQNMAPIELELLPLCEMVVQGVEIQWEMTEKWCRLLGNEILSRLTVEQKELLMPFTEGMYGAFFEQRYRFGYSGEVSETVA